MMLISVVCYIKENMSKCNRLGIHLFKKIEVKQGNNVLATITPSYILSRIASLPENVASYYDAN